jgi:ankyrin repeat protein
MNKKVLYSGIVSIVLGCATANAQWCTLVAMGHDDTNRQWCPMQSWGLREELRSNDLQVVKDWLTKETNVNVRHGGNTVLLHGAAYWGRKDICELLMSKGADPNITDDEGKTPLHYAAIFNGCEMGSPCSKDLVRGKIEVCELLIRKGAKVNVRDKGNYGDVSGNTPLHYACSPMFSSPPPELLRTMVELLISRGADVATTNNAGQTALHCLLSFGVCSDSVNIIQQFVTGGGNINAKDSDGRTPFELAGESGMTNIWRFLLTNGADVVGIDKMGRTPLHLAAIEGQTNVCEMLIAVGADVGARDTAGKTPVDLAADKPLAEFLRRNEKRKSADRR